MLNAAAERGFAAESALFGTWHASLENLEFIRSLDWLWPARLERSRHIDPDKTKNRPVKQALLSEEGDIVRLEGCGMIKVFKKVGTEDGIGCWATNDLKTADLMRLKHAEISWTVETCRRGIKQFCGAEHCRARSERARRNHVGMAPGAFLLLEHHCFAEGISWW